MPPAQQRRCSIASPLRHRRSPSTAWCCPRSSQRRGPGLCAGGGPRGGAGCVGAGCLPAKLPSRLAPEHRAAAAAGLLPPGLPASLPCRTHTRGGGGADVRCCAAATAAAAAAARRNAMSADRLVDTFPAPDDHVRTLFENLENTIAKCPDVSRAPTVPGGAALAEVPGCMQEERRSLPVLALFSPVAGQSWEP